jgi:Rap1a immunity proteins
MRAYVIAVGLALSVTGSASGKVVETGADLQKYCRPLIEGSFHDSDEARSAGSCEGVVATTMAFSPNLPAEVRACPPAQGSISESVKILLQYLDKNPDRLNEPAISVAIEAFRDAWPCDGDDGEASAKPKPKKRALKKSKQEPKQELKQEPK